MSTEHSQPDSEALPLDPDMWARLSAGESIAEI
jgi:hypothetical protein